MAIHLGTVAPIGFEDFPPAEWLGCFRRLGCTVVQVYRNVEADVKVSQIREALDAGGLPCDSLHGIFGEPFDPSAPDEAARRAAIDAYRGEGELAAELKGPLVVVHCSTVRRDGVPADERKRRVAQLKRSIAELGRFGQGIGVRYAFENLPSYHPLGADVAELAAILKDVDAPSTGLCFDSGHANIVGDAAAAVADTGGRMIYMHFSDNSGQADEHEMPTCASLDAEAVARALRDVGYRDTMMLEVFYPVEKLERLLADGCAERLAHLVALANGR